MCAINTAEELLKMMRLGCYKVESRESVLEVSPSFSIDDEMASLIRKYKTELLNILENNYRSKET